MTRRTQAEMAAIEAAAEESARQAEQDATEAAEAREHSEWLARKIRQMTAANHFAWWIYRDGAS